MVDPPRTRDREDMPDPQRPITVFAVDDHPAVLASVALVVDACPGFRLVGGAPNGEAALDQLRRDGETPDLILMDVHMPGLDGVATARALAAADIASAVVLMSTADREDLPSEAFVAPVRGFLPKAELSTHALTRLWADVVGADARR